MGDSICLSGAKTLKPEGCIETADLRIADGVIVQTSGPNTHQGDRRIDCRGLYVLPGIVDVHGDAFELELHPRPGVDIDFSIAMGSVDRQLLSNGISTVFHGLTLSWEPGARSLDAGRRFMSALPNQRASLTADHRVQLRWETFAHDAIEDISLWLEQSPPPAIAFNDHTTSTIQKARAGDRAKLDRWALRAGVSLEQYLADIETIARRAADVPAAVQTVAELARRRGAVMLSHDERLCEERLAFRALGARLCEFPLSREVAADAVANGEHVVMGGPNVIRGGSHTGGVSAEDAVRDGLCTVLASDYYYPSLLHAAERLVSRGVCGLAQAWALLSANPAAAMGLHDRGAIEIGRRADLVVLDLSGPWRLAHMIAGGAVTSFTQ